MPLTMTSPGEVLRLMTLFHDEHWAKYRCSVEVDAVHVEAEVYLRLGGAWNAYDPRLIRRARRQFLGSHHLTHAPLERVECTPFDWSDSVHAAMDRAKDSAADEQD